MTQPAWLTKWQAREALQNGQPQEAHRLLEQLLQKGDRRAWALRSDVVRGYVDRLHRLLRQEDIEAAWADLARVESIAPSDHRISELRHTLTRLGLAEIRACLECGKPLQAIQAAARLKERPAHSPELAPLEEAAQEWILAQEIAERGDFQLARQALERARRRFGGRSDALDRFEERLGEREERYRTAVGRLKESLGEGKWKESIDHADEVLAVASQQPEIQQTRRRAWLSLQTGQTPPASIKQQTTVHSPNPPSSVPVKRFLLWIDGVGSYLICLGARVAIGQSSPENPVDIPLLADISRVHACLTRDGDQYVFESNKGATVNGSALERTLLNDGDRIMVGGVHFGFHLPLPGSATARLDCDQSRRLPHAVNAVLLMGEMLVIGPGSQAHIIADWPQTLYLVKVRENLEVRWKGDFYLDGESRTDKCEIRGLQAAVSSDCFSFALEPFSPAKER